MSPSGEKLRIGLLVNSFTIPFWAYRMLERIKEDNQAEIVCVVRNTASARRPGFWKRNWRNRKYLLYLLFCDFERKFVKVSPDAFAPRDLNDLVKDVPVLEVEPVQKKYSDYFKSGDLERIGSFKTDVMIRLGFRILRGKILSIPKYGIWSFHHGDNESLRGGPACVWEVIENCPLTGAVLQVLTENLDNGVILHRSYAATNPLSIKKNRNNIYWMNVSILPNLLKETAAGGEAKFKQRVEETNQNLNFYSHRLYRRPLNREFLPFLFRWTGRKIKDKMRRLFLRKNWYLLYHQGNSPAMSLWKYKRINPPGDRFWADPFPVRENDRFYIFIEEYLFKKHKGYISVIKLGKDGAFTKPKKIIERSNHLSYPCIFRFDNQYHMILSESTEQKINLFTCRSFPDVWEHSHTLMTGVDTVDATLYEEAGRWWLFLNLREYEGASRWDSLHLFYADSPFSRNWIPHPKNPIVTDVRKARPAGRIFSFEGDRYRPSQDCSQGYGYGIRFHQIDILNEEEYREHEVASIFPLWDKKMKGIHIFNFIEGLTVADGKEFLSLPFYS